MVFLMIDQASLSGKVVRSVTMRVRCCIPVPMDGTLWEVEEMH